MYKMEFDKSKSHLSALQKATFEEAHTKESKIEKVPGIGEKTKKVLNDKNINTIDDLVSVISNDFAKLCAITPSSGVNNHKIYDALEVFLDQPVQATTPRVTVFSNSHNMQEFQKVDSCKMQ